MVKGMSKKQFPCGDYKKACELGCLLCEVCDSWFHSTCEVITSKDFMTWSSIDEGYICDQHCSIGGKCDYLMGITRLQKAANIGLEKLKASVEREDLLSDEKYCSCKYAEHPSLPVNAIAADILLQYHAEKGVPLRTTGDGNCLFNTISIILCGNEFKSIELRYKTTLMMVLEESAILGHPNRSSIHLLSPDYSDAALNCTQIGSFSSAWTMIAIVMVTKHPLHSVYPVVNGTKDLAFRALNTTFNHAAEGSTISLMWSNVTKPANVLLVKKKKNMDP